MRSDPYIKSIAQWTKIIYDPDNELIPKLTTNPVQYRKIFIDKISESLYEDMRRSRMLITAPFSFNRDFSKLGEEEKKIWYDYAAAIPGKLGSLNLFIRPYKTFFRTCIITDDEIQRLAQIDLELYLKETNTGFENLPEARKWYFRELNYLLPPQLVKAGFEIIRKEEETLADNILIRKLARTIHSRYLQDIRNRNIAGEQTTAGYPGDKGNLHLLEFENLPEDIIFSNLDNAFHIPTKLLAIGYKIRPVQKGHQPITLHLDEEQTETMAYIEHLRWSWDKRLNGWIFGNTKDHEKKVHPGLIPYNDLPDHEKEKDRALVRLIPSLLQDIGYVAYPVSTENQFKLSYAIKPQSSIQKLLAEIRKLNTEIEGALGNQPGVTEKLKTSNSKIEEIINEVQGSYIYARHIQATYLPDDLYVRECFPDSFILYKPKDVVSGDFYFFSRKGDTIVFAAADCTGHGIPGALISTLGYGIIDQAVNQANLICPSEILHYLFDRVHKFLRKDEIGTGMSDDMDIAVCALDLETRMLEYSGVGSPVFLIRDEVLTEYKARNLIENCTENSEYPFLSDLFEFKTGDTIYLFSDGYTDQFGGKFHKRYQRSRLKSFLLNIQHYTMPEQREKLYEEIETWREENDEDQTDDIMVIGIRI
jgi:serine phosphatase RsbU (regulator of sigma subunit)